MFVVCFQCVKELTNEVGNNPIAEVCTNSHCKEGVVGHVKQKSQWLYPYFYPCSIALLKESLVMWNRNLNDCIHISTRAPLRYWRSRWSHETEISMIVSIFLPLLHCAIEGVVGHVKQKSQWLYPYFYPCSIALLTPFLTGKCVSHGGLYRLEIPVNFYFGH